MHKIPFDVFIHSENALIRAKEMDALLLKLMDLSSDENESEVNLFSAFHTLLATVIDELNKSIDIYNRTRAEE